MLQRAPHNSTKEEREEAIRDQSLVPSPPSPIKTFYARKKRSKGKRGGKGRKDPHFDGNCSLGSFLCFSLWFIPPPLGRILPLRRGEGAVYKLASFMRDKIRIKEGFFFPLLVRLGNICVLVHKWKRNRNCSRRGRLQRVSFSLSLRAKVHHPPYLLFFLSCFKAPHPTPIAVAPHGCAADVLEREDWGRGGEEEGLSARIIGVEEERRRRAGTDSPLFCADTPLFLLLLRDRSLSRYLPPGRGQLRGTWCRRCCCYMVSASPFLFQSRNRRGEASGGPN